MVNNMQFFEKEILSNSTAEWLLALGVFLATLVILKIFKTVIISKIKIFAKKTKTEMDDAVAAAIENIPWPFYVFISIYIALNFLNISSLVDKYAHYVFMIVVVFYIARLASQLIEFGTRLVVEKRTERKEAEGIARILSVLIKIVLWSGVIIWLLSNMGYNVTSAIAGLGVGGVAVALALQNILGDLFSSISIYLDKPFKVGDFVAVGDQMGVVEKIGIKTTRIRVLQGEELVVSNTELTVSQVRNFGLLERRRSLFAIGVEYDTSVEKLKKIPGLIKTIIEKEKDVQFDRAHFKEYGSFALIFEVVYYKNTNDYVEFLDTLQGINLAIKENFEKEGVIMAFPTQTVHIKK